MPSRTIIGDGASVLVQDEIDQEIEAPTGGGWLERIEIGRLRFGYMANVTLKPGVVYPVKLFDAVRTGRAADYILLQYVTCFGPDGRITTLKGLRRTADLRGGSARW